MWRFRNSTNTMFPKSPPASRRQSRRARSVARRLRLSPTLMSRSDVSLRSPGLLVPDLLPPFSRPLPCRPLQRSRKVIQRHSPCPLSISTHSLHSPLLSFVVPIIYCILKANYAKTRTSIHSLLTITVRPYRRSHATPSWRNPSALSMAVVCHLTT
jgi:hypothetical protein